MAVNTTNTKYFYPPRPGNGGGTFSDNIVGLQTVEGGGLTQGNFEFTTGVTEKVNRTFNVGAFSEPMTLDMMNIDSVEESRRILATQFRVYPNFDITQVLNFSMYGSLSERFRVSITRVINYFPASLDIIFTNSDFSTGNTAYDIVYDVQNDETYFKVNVDRIKNPFDIDYSISASTNLTLRELDVSPYRNLNNTYLDYCVSIDDNIYKVLAFIPSTTLTSGDITFYVSGSPFGTTATTIQQEYQIRPNDYIVDKIFQESFDEVEKFLLNRLVEPPYTAVFQIPSENENGQFTTSVSPVTWPLDGPYNLDIRTPSFDLYLEQINKIAIDFDIYKTDLLSRFLTQESFK